MLNKENLIIILDKLFDQSKKYYDDFNSADAKIGDGDLGITILHGLEEIQKNKVSFSNDMGENFMVCSKAFVKRSGSSFGTLIAFSLMNISKKMQGKTHCDHNDIINFFENQIRLDGYNFKDEVFLGIRPEHIDVNNNNNIKLDIKVDLIENLGSEKIIYASIKNQEIRIKTAEKLVKNLNKISFSQDNIYFFDKNGNRLRKTT